MKLIALTRRMAAIVDEENYKKLSKYKWYAHKAAKTFYARTNISIGNGKYRGVYMHRMIIDIPGNLQTDHVNGNGLDNRIANLRVCNQTENLQNRSGSEKSTSVFKGVHWDSRDKRWIAKIKKDGFHIVVGRFKSEIEAAREYDKAAIKYHGEFARVNFVPVTG